MKELITGTVIKLSIVTLLSIICCISLVKVASDKTKSPEFCADCHSMGPYYNTWKDTVECNTGCLNCHTHDNSGRTLSVEIQDTNCTNTECHSLEKLNSKSSKYKDTISFEHKSHLKEYPTNIKLLCVACHSYTGKEESKGGKDKHFGIDKNACFVCHFTEGDTPLLDTRNKKRIDDCSLCHKDVQLRIKIYNKEFDHLKYEKKLKVECSNCHFETTHKGDIIDRGSCYYCHKKIPKDYTDVDRIHNDHVKEHKVPCSPCHKEIRHEWGSEYIAYVLPERDTDMQSKFLMRNSGKGAVPIPADISTSENEVALILDEVPYLLQNNIYKGVSGRGVEGSPDPMYLATVKCIACHTNKQKNVAPKTCNTCHEKGFDKTLAEQKEYIERLLKELSGLIIGPRNQEVAKDLIDEAKYNYDLIIDDGSFGVHNIKYVKDLINYSIDRLKAKD